MNRHPTCLLLLACALPAQGLRWSDPSQKPTLYAREHADGRSWTLCFDGWSMTAGVPFAGGNEAAGIGINPGARSVSSTSADVLKGGEGGKAFVELFPFASDARVLPAFAPKMPGLDRYGFLAPINPGVPEAGLASLAFRVTLLGPMSPSVLLPFLATTRVGVVTADPQGNPTGRVFVVAPGRVQLARVLYYLFDRGAGAAEINAAGIEGGAQAQAMLSRPSGSPWTSGRFGAGLRAGTTVDTGFYGDLGGSFTLAWFMRGAVAPTGASSILGIGGWRVFTGGAAGNGVRCVGWGGATLDLTDDVQALAAAGWVHIALVVDGSIGRAAWFVNGVLRSSLAISSVVNIPASNAPLEIGSTQGLVNVYDLDEVRLDASPQSMTTIAQWVLRSSPAALPFTSACGASLRSSGQPLLGGTLRYRIEAAPGSSVALALGFGTMLGPFALPLDLGVFVPALAGCPWYSDLAIALPAQTVPSSGILPVPLTLPANPVLVGLEVYAQALVNGPGGLAATNAHLISIQ